MMQRDVRRRLLASSLLAGAALAGFGPGAALAQTAAPGSEVEEVVVTGTRILRDVGEVLG